MDLEAWVEWKEWVKGGGVKMVVYPEEIVDELHNRVDVLTEKD